MSGTKDPKIPKKPLPTYFLWQRENRERITKDVGPKAFLKAAAKEWKALSEKEKGEWKKRADEDKARYEREMEQYEAGGKKVKK